MSTQDSTLFQAEAAVLCAFLSNADETIPRVQKMLPASDFHGRAHRSIAEAMYALHAEGITIDPLTVCARLEQHGVLKAVGGMDYIHDLQDVTPTAANATYHARLVKQDADRRRAVVYLTKTLEGLKDGRANLREIAQEVQTVMLPLALEDDGRGFRWISKQDVEDVLHELDRRANRISEGLLPGIPTGYGQIDRITQGFRPGEFVIFGGRDKSLKSYLVQNIFVNMAFARVHCGLVSAEMMFGEVMERFLGTASLVGVHDLARGSITGTERERITREGARLTDFIAIDDEAGPELGDVVARCTELKARQPRLQALGVDYLQLVQNRMQGRRGDEEINHITRTLKALFKRLSVVGFALAQCNHKDLETRSDRRPQIRDFQGASGMAQDPDFRGMLYHARQYDINAPPVLEVGCSGRRVSPFEVFLDYDPRSLAIYEKKQVRAIA